MIRVDPATAALAASVLADVRRVQLTLSTVTTQCRLELADAALADLSGTLKALRVQVRQHIAQAKQAQRDAERDRARWDANNERIRRQRDGAPDLSALHAGAAQ